MDSFYTDDAHPNHSEQQLSFLSPLQKSALLSRTNVVQTLFSFVLSRVWCDLCSCVCVSNFEFFPELRLLVRARILQLRNPNLNLVLRRRSFVLLLEHLAQSVEDGVQLLVFDIHFL